VKRVPQISAASKGDERRKPCLSLSHVNAKGAARENRGFLEASRQERHVGSPRLRSPRQASQEKRGHNG
jgi:hypothetical protein